MACLFCFSKEPLSNDELRGKYANGYSRFANNTRNTYHISMCQAPCVEPCCWVTSVLCLCPAQVYMRHRVLNHVDPNSGWKNYTCCQGYFGGCCCLQPGNLGESACPVLCMCLEACLCPGLAVSSTSHVIRERYSLGLDEDDVRLIRCNNCLFFFSACLSCVACMTECEGDDQLADIVGLIQDIVFCCVGGCMTAQVHHEMNRREDCSPLRQLMTR